MEWKTCVQNPNYEVSDTGLVRRALDKRQLRLRLDDGYHRAKLFIGGERIFLVHVLVCTAFHGHAPLDKPLACHKNDIPTDNTVENLYWGDRKDNLLDAHRNLRIRKGEEVTVSKLTLLAAAEIRKQRLDCRLSEYQLAKCFNVSRPTISAVLRGRTWRFTEAGYDGRDLTKVVPKQNPPNTVLTEQDKTEIREKFRPKVYGHTLLPSRFA